MASQRFTLSGGRLTKIYTLADNANISVREMFALIIDAGIKIMEGAIRDLQKQKEADHG